MDAKPLLPSSSKAKRKNALQIFLTSKEPKIMDNPVIAEDMQITNLHDQLFRARSKAHLEAKTQMKKVASAEKNLVKKLEKACKKA